MSTVEHNLIGAHARPYALPLDTLQRGILWLLIAVSWCVFVEPAPYELVFIIALVLFLPYGMSASRALVPLVAFLLLYNLGGILSVLPRMDEQDAAKFTTVSCYMAVTALFFAGACAKAPLNIVAVIRHAYIWAAVIASVVAIGGYFDVAGTAETLSPMGRAQGFFKDPNVFSTYLILPAVFLVHSLVSGQQRWQPLALVALIIIMAGNFLAFSRGAWLAMALSIFVAMGLTFVISTSVALRGRIVLFAFAGSIALVGLVVFALSFHEVSTMFTERAKLVQAYDTGEMGRFARQLNSIPVIISAPNGVGMWTFVELFGEDPHNVYVNAFVSYGWLGGISYLLLTIATLSAGWRTIMTRSPWQHLAIVVFACLFVAMLQGMQIDTDHWRHFYLELGMMWGLYAATEDYRPRVHGSPPVVPSTVSVFAEIQGSDDEAAEEVMPTVEEPVATTDRVEDEASAAPEPEPEPDDPEYQQVSQDRIKTALRGAE